MAEYIIMKAVEFSKLPAKFKKQYRDEKGLAEAGFWMQKKYDGCMGVAEVWPQEPEKSRMLSRTGEDYTKSCGHILDALNRALDNAPRCGTPVCVIGEVWQPIEEAAFPEISGKFRRQSPSPELKFVVNDLLPLEKNTTQPYSARFHDLTLFLDDDPDDIIQIATTLFDTCDEPMAQALEWQGAGGFDGGILRNPDAGYTVGTVKNGEIVKIKPTLSLDLRVTNQFREIGEKTGRDVWSIEVVHLGVHTRVGSGVPHDHAAVPAIHEIAEIECLGITADGKLREPRLKGIRHDKVAPDA